MTATLPVAMTTATTATPPVRMMKRTASATTTQRQRCGATAINRRKGRRPTTRTTTRTRAVSDNAPSSNADGELMRDVDDDGTTEGTTCGDDGEATKPPTASGGTEGKAKAVASGGTNGRTGATDSAAAVRGTWEDVGGGSGGDGSSGGGSGGGGSGGDGSGEGDSTSGGSTWLRTETRELHGATEGGALFGTLVAVAMNGVAWVFFAALKPSRSEREKYALETRQAETATKERAKAERAARREMEKAEKRRSVTTKPTSVVASPKTVPATEAVVETTEAIGEDRNDEADSSLAKRARAPTVEDNASTSSDSSGEDSAVKIVSVQHRPIGTSASEGEALGPEASSADSIANDAESAFEEHTRECEEEQRRVEECVLEKGHHNDEQYLPAHEEHPNYKIVRAVREANALMHDVHARRTEVNQEFAEALRYRKQVIHMAAEHGIPVAPIREIKETFDQEELPALGVTAREKANKAARSALSATKKFVHFATPHVQTASSKAFEFTKDAAGKAKTAVNERLKDVKAKQASGELRAPTMDEAIAAAKSTSRQALGAVIHAYDRIAGHIRELKP